MPTYDELKSELLEISTIVEKFPEQVKPQVYELLVRQFLGKKAVAESARRGAVVCKKTSLKKPATEDPGKMAKTRKPTTKESYSIDPNLNLAGDKSIPSFKQFYEEKKPNPAKEFNAVAVYYLKKMLGETTATLDMAYTCYREVKKKPPQAFRQSFIDTKNKEGWIEFDQAGNLGIPHRGSVFVEHDLPRPEKKKKSKS